MLNILEAQSQLAVNPVGLIPPLPCAFLGSMPELGLLNTRVKGDLSCLLPALFLGLLDPCKGEPLA